MAKIKLSRPMRDPDHYSKRGVPYWWAPEWIRGTSADNILSPEQYKNMMTSSYVKSLNTLYLVNLSGDYVNPCDSYGRIHAVKESSGDVNLYMKSKEGKLTYIQGSIQKEFKKWHLDREIDYILLGLNPDDILQNETE